MNGTSKYTVWHYVGCGCAVLLVLGILGVGGCFVMVTRWGKQVEREIKDPAARAAKAQAILGYDQLPEGYHPGIALSMPFFMEMAMLGDRELPAGEDLERMGDRDDLFEERGFLYFKVRSLGDAEQEVRDELNYDFEADERVAEGEVEAGGATIRYRADLGTAHLDGDEIPSISAEMDVECGDGFLRRAIWFTPAPGVDPAAEGRDAAAYAGTPADEASLREFLDHFDFCG